MVGFKPLKSNQVPNGKNDRMTLAGGYIHAQKESK